MKFIYNFFITLILLVSIFLVFFTSKSFAQTDIPINSEACILMDADFGKVLYEKKSTDTNVAPS